MSFLVRCLIFLALQEDTNIIGHTKLSPSFILQIEQTRLSLRALSLAMEQGISLLLPPQVEERK